MELKNSYMESINETIEKTLHFLSIIQNACDSKRLHIDQYSFKCYTSYIKEWKAEQNKVELALEKNHKANYNAEEEQREDMLLTEDFEELSLADALLEKARAIRSKNKVVPKQIIKLEHSPKSETILDDGKSNVNTSKRIAQRDIVKVLRKNYTTLPNSKSTLHFKSFKNSKMTRSKSLSNYMSRKEINVPNINPTIKKDLQISTHVKNGTLKKSEVGIVSNRQFIELTCISNNQNLSEYHQGEVRKTETQCVTLNSGSPQSASHRSALSYKSFKNSLRSGTVNLKSHFQLQKEGFWYPFMNFNNKTSFFEWTKCNTFESFIKVVKLMYKIQEMMLWIDLLSMLGKEMLPYLKILDNNDKNVVHLCSYLSSIYHESLQRIPMLSLD